MDNLRQLWVVKIHPNETDVKNNLVYINTGGIKVSQLGHLITANTDGYSRNSRDTGAMKQIMDNIKPITSDDLKNAKALYRFPHLNLSRDKVKILQEKFDLKVKRDFNDADYGIVSDKYFDKLFISSYLGAIDIADIRSWMSVYEDCMDCDTYLTFSAQLDRIPEDAYVCMEATWFSSYEILNFDSLSNNDRYREMHEKIRNKKKQGYHYYIKSLDQWNDIQTSIHRLVWDTNINELATEDSEILTLEHYTQLKTMLGWQKNESGCGWSGDRDMENVNLALTIIANCNINESRTYLGMLFAFLSDSMKDSSVWTTVNFKSVRKEFQHYIDLSGWTWGHTYNSLTKHLIDDKSLTEWSFSEISSRMFNDLFASQYGLTGNSCFTIDASSIQLKTKYKEKMQVEQVVLDDLEAMVDVNTESNKL